MPYKRLLSNFSKYKLFTNKGLTFKGALVAAIALHFVGAGIFWGYIKYQSYRYQIAKQEHEARLQQKNLNDISWNNNTLKLKVVAVPPPKQITKKTIESKLNYEQFIKTSTKFALNLLTKARSSFNETAAFIDSQFNDRPKNPQKIQTSSTQNKSKQAQSVNKQQKQTVWKASADKHQPKYVQTKKPELSQGEKRLAKALEYDKKKAKTETITITLPPSVARSIPPTKKVPSVNTRLISSNSLTENQIINSNQINSPLKYTSEVDQQTNEVVHTFYSY